MSVPKPPFHSATEELLYSIYQKLSATMPSLTTSDINTLAKLNAILTDADLMNGEDVTDAINALKGNAPVTGDTLEKLYNIIQALNYLKAEDIDTLAEINAIITDADLIKAEDLTAAISALKGNVSNASDTLEKLFTLLQPVLSAWLQDGNNTGAIKALGTKDNFPLPFITSNVECARFDENGNFLIGHTDNAAAKIHMRTHDALEASFAAYIDDPELNILLGISNSGKLFLNKDRSNLLINGGWLAMTGVRNLILTSGAIGAKVVDSGNDNVIIGYNPASSPGSNPIRTIERNVVIGAEAGSTDVNGTGYVDSVYIGYRTGWQIEPTTGQRNTMIGASAGALAPQGGNDHTLIGYDSQNARSNTYNTLIGSGTRAYNSLGDLITSGGSIAYASAIGAGAIVRTANTIVLGRAALDQVVIGAESNNRPLPGISLNTGLCGYKIQIINPGGLSLGVSGSSLFRDGGFSINLGEDGNATIKNTFRINSYIGGLGGFDFMLGANNLNASIEIKDYLFGGTRNEMVRLSPSGLADTAILIRPNDVYNTTYGYRYILQGTNAGQQSRYVSAFNAQLNFPLDDSFATQNSVQLFSAKAGVTNHFIDGFYADVRGTDSNAQAFAYHSTGSRIFFDGNGMTFGTPVVSITTDGSAQPGANNNLLNGSPVISAALLITPLGGERTGLIISPGQSHSNGAFISPQQGIGSYYDGYLLWLQYSTNGNSIMAGTSKPMLYIRKHNAQLNGFDHTGAFIRLEENIGSTGNFIEAYKYDAASNTSRLKFAVDKQGILSLGQVYTDPASISTVCRLYFIYNELRIVTPTGEIKVVDTYNPT